MSSPVSALAGLFEAEGVSPESVGGRFWRVWRSEARVEQLPPGGRWRTWYLRGGRGSGKTHAGSKTLAGWILEDPVPGEWGVVAPTYQDAWSTCVEGPSGLLAALGTSKLEVEDGSSRLVKHWHRTFGELLMRSGHVVRVASAQDGGLRIQGKNLKAAWCDEIGLWDKWETTWDESLKYAVREGRSQIVATGTPKMSRSARKLVRRLLEDPAVPVSLLRTQDNAANLSELFLAETVGKALGTRLERQELEGELLSDVEGALWSAELIEEDRVESADVPDLTRVVVAVDPATTGRAGSDEHGIVVVGCAGGHAYVLEDCSMRGSPDAAMRRAVRAYRRWSADRIVAEANNGGDFIGGLLRTVDPNAAFRKVTASRGKAIRAEPVSALYEQHRVHHVGVHTELEDQMVTWSPGDSGSPDRMDALVWACTELGTLGAASWGEAYGVVSCACGGRPFVARLHASCPACGAPVEGGAEQGSALSALAALRAVR